MRRCLATEKPDRPTGRASGGTVGVCRTGVRAVSVCTGRDNGGGGANINEVKLSV